MIYSQQRRVETLLNREVKDISLQAITLLLAQREGVITTKEFREELAWRMRFAMQKVLKAVQAPA